MQYIYKDDQGNEVGPIAHDAMLQLITRKVVTKNTEVRNAMLSTFSPASSHAALADTLSKIEPDSKRRVNETDYEFRRRKDKEWQKQEKSSAMVRTGSIGEAGFAMRITAFLIDMVVLAIIMLALILSVFQGLWNEPVRVMKWNGYNYQAASEKIDYGGPYNLWQKQYFQFFDKEHVIGVRNESTQTAVYLDSKNMRLKILSCMTFLGMLTALYYVFSLGYFAQTIGMWFCGCVLVRDNKADPAAYEIRYMDAFRYYIMLWLLGWTYPLTMLFTKKQGLHCMLIRVKVANVASSPV